MKRLAALVLLGATLPAVAGSDAPYCVYGNAPPSCFYYTLTTCRYAARGSGGMCAPNNQSSNAETVRPRQTAPQQGTSVLELMKHVQESGEAGRRAGMEQRQNNQQTMQAQGAQADAALRFNQAAALNQAQSETYLKLASAAAGAVTLPNGTIYRVLEAGNGPTPAATSDVSLEVDGPFPWGNRPVEAKPPSNNNLRVNEIQIRAISDVLTRMPEGSRWQIILPSNLAFGSDPASPFPPNVAVEFGVRLKQVQCERTPPPRAACIN